MELSPRMVFQRKISIYFCLRFKVFFQVFGKLNACNCSYGSRGQNNRNHLFVEKTLLTKEGPNLPQYGVARKPITSEVGIQAKKKNRNCFLPNIKTQNTNEPNKILIEKFQRSFSKTKWVNYFLKHLQVKQQWLTLVSFQFLICYKFNLISFLFLGKIFCYHFYSDKQIK